MRKRLTVKAARDAKRWTQEVLEAKSGVNQSTISKLERGEVEDPSKSTVDALEDALQLQRGTLVFGAEAEALAS